MRDYKRVRVHLSDLASQLTEWGTEVLSVHAPQGMLTDLDFPTWATEVGRFAAAIGVTEVTLHPSRCPESRHRFHRQRKVMRTLKRVEAACRVTFGLETFESNERLFGPNEIIRLGLPMVQDVAYIYRHRDVMSSIAQYHSSIVTVHLSAKGQEEHHLPIDAECLEVVETLRGHRWAGNIILEYLPRYHERLESDLAMLRERFEGSR